MKRILAEQFLDSLTRVRVMLDIQTLQLTLHVSRQEQDNDEKCREQVLGPFDSIGALRDGLRQVLGEAGIASLNKKAGARPAFRVPDVGAA